MIFISLQALKIILQRYDMVFCKDGDTLCEFNSLLSPQQATPYADMDLLNLGTT